jgi:predicted nucleic acid-binding protein
MQKKRAIAFDKLTLAIQEFAASFVIAPISLSTIEVALTIASRYYYSYFDSLILSSALEYHCTRIYTEDMHHGQLVENTLTVYNPFRDL